MAQSPCIGLYGPFTNNLPFWSPFFHVFWQGRWCNTIKHGQFQYLQQHLLWLCWVQTKISVIVDHYSFKTASLHKYTISWWWLNQPICKICWSDWIISPISGVQKWLKPPPSISFNPWKFNSSPLNICPSQKGKIDFPNIVFQGSELLVSVRIPTVTRVY